MLQSKSQTQIFLVKRPSPKKNYFVYKGTKCREARSYLGRPLQSCQSIQTRNLLAGRHGRESPSSPLECQTLEEILSIICLCTMRMRSPCKIKITKNYICMVNVCHDCLSLWLFNKISPLITRNCGCFQYQELPFITIRHLDRHCGCCQYQERPFIMIW